MWNGEQPAFAHDDRVTPDPVEGQQRLATHASRAAEREEVVRVEPGVAEADTGQRAGTGLVDEADADVGFPIQLAA